jgi:DNA-binding GntR family transcriptional regulator
MPVPQQRRAVPRRLLRDDAYSVLCDAIVTGTLAPGEQLRDAELCEWLGLSRTPVRDALARLEDEGLVESAPQRFTRVAPLLARDAQDTFPVLASLHALAAELGTPQLGRAELDRLRAANSSFLEALRRGDADLAYEADERFHRVFVDASANAEIDRVLGRLTPRLRRLERLRVGVLPGRRSLAQHEAIISRASDGDARGAASATRENWLEFGALVERSLAARAWEDAGHDASAP